MKEKSMRFSIPRALLQLAAAMPFVLVSVDGFAQAYPSRLVRIIVAGSAGSSMDTSARALADPMSKSWGVPVIVDVRPGANSVIGADAVAKSAPDGYTLLYAFTPFVQAPNLTAKMPYDTITSFTPVAQATVNPLWFAISAEVPATSVKEFVAVAKASPGKYSYGSPGQGSTPHLFGHVLSQRNGLDLLHVPHKGIPPAVLDVVAGRLSGIFASYSDVGRQAQAGKLRILATTGTSRSRLTPEIPTMQEAGFAGFDAVGFGGFLAPAGTPRPVVERISKTVNETVAMPDVGERLASFGLEPVSSTPESFGALLRTQLDVWKQVMVAAGVKAE
jgi:tripartite-type tricarboxylate transporter receptor subunit TctC